ncbi:M14 family metallopeptidase [Parasediminibacterium sp. JCM 36343]|uniref:M14 family metallopeptidase n=1 Tax=Parasediminibacterium sp. JCM 36343 TaxID=3374279 RepID=UPI003978269C
MLQSPDQFLGYKLGTKFTRHDKIVAYCKAVAAANPAMVRIEKYGETNEGRELMVAYISSPENIKNLDLIRLNNLRLASLAKDRVPPVVNGAPAVIWLSYNVHGNEPASSEAAMLTLFALIDPANTATKAWLKNTVVIIDPCLNPDGRDRYVNWYNSVVGSSYNPNPQSREHIEPWPQGRSNHYNFDLNRDWAWQTQVETRQRMKLYSQWMPQIHVDYHEQGYNEPYYFAPAAEPFHEVITPWQREFQNLIGKNHAKYFDANGWLYFTKERFDLFYPSYGDTYPIYNGAIGMTYEQGGIRAGLGIKTDDGDTLTLQDRIQHHYTTGISTIETASSNAQKLVDGYKQFFDDNKAAKKFTYKTYILTSDNVDKLQAAEKLLHLNGIEYGSIGSTAFKGFNYVSQKEETVSLKKYHIAIGMLQPRSTLATVLLEPKGNLSDSNTYDITAWSIPFTYGLDAYAVKEALPITETPYTETITPPAVPQSNYGYLIKYNSFSSAKVLANLLKKGVKIRFASKPFAYNKQNYDRGTLIILNKGNSNDVNVKIANALAGTAITADVVSSGFMDKGADFGSPDIRFIVPPKVAMLTGEQTSSLSAGEVWDFFDQQLEYPISLFNTIDLGKINLNEYTVLILPDGNYKNINDKIITEKLKTFVQSGGKIIALQDAVQQMSNGDWGLKAKDDKKDSGEDSDKDKDKDKKSDYSSLKKFADKDRAELSNTIPGAIYKIDLDNTHPLAYGYLDYYFTLKQDDNIYQFLKDGWNVGTIKKDAYTTGFSGTKVKAKLKDGLLFGVQEMGSGSIVYLSDDPLFRLFWENGKLLFSNAVFLVGQ